jgi:hypothetical protein
MHVTMTLTDLRVIRVNHLGTQFTVLDQQRGCQFRVDATCGVYSCTCCGNVVGAVCRHIATVRAYLAHR